MAIDPTIPRYAQPDVLAITGLRPAVLQTWVNRNAIELAEQNPGSGRKRLYSTFDVIKLAVMRRLADFSVDLAVSKDLAEATIEYLMQNGEMEWEHYVRIRPRAASEQEPQGHVFVRYPPPSRLDQYIHSKQDLYHLRMSQLVEPPDFLLNPPRRRRKDVLDENQDRTIDEEARYYWARQGIHAEPIIFIPLGEIVNGTLAQLDQLIEARGIEED